MEVDSELVFSCKKFEDTLVNSQECFNRDSGILDNANHPMFAPHPSLAELAQFAKASYKSVKTNEEHMFYQHRLSLPSGWKLLTTACNNRRFNGYFGLALWNPSLQYVVLAHQGMKNMGNMLSTGFNGIYHNNYTSGMSSAVTFADKVRCAINEANKHTGKQFQLSIAGHSAGGWLAQITGLTVKYLRAEKRKFIQSMTSYRQDGIHAHVVAFDSPGCKNMLEKIIDSYCERYKKTVYLESLDISNYMAIPNWINTYGLHVGSMYQVDISNRRFNHLYFYSYSLFTHRIDNLINAFLNNRNIYEITNWPLNRSQQVILGRTEYQQFHQNMRQEGEFHLDSPSSEPNNERSLDIHYRTEQISNLANLRMFSDNEFELLNFRHTFKRDNITDGIHKFLSEHNLGEWSKLFKHFDINIINRTIKCETKEDLDEVIRRAKLLVRWFSAELMDLVGRHSIEKCREIYLKANCVDSSLLWDFTDSVGLKGFLESAHRVLQIKSEDCDLEMIGLFSIARQMRGVSSHLDEYVKRDCQTFLHYTKIEELELIDIENLPDFTNDNLLVINYDSTYIPQDFENRKILKNFFNNINKKLILVSDYEMSHLHRLKGETVMVDDRLKHFVSNQLMEDSQKKLFERDILKVGDEYLSIADFIGKTNFDNFSSSIGDLIDSTKLKKIIMDKDFIMKIENSRPILTMNFSTVDRKVSVGDLLKNARSCDRLVISGNDQDEMKRMFTEVNRVAENKVSWVSAGLEKFKQIALEKPNEEVYWIEADNASITATVKQMYDKSLYISRRFHHIVFRLEQVADILNQVEDIFIFRDVTSKESLAELSRLTEAEKGILLESVNVFTAASDQEVKDILKKYYEQPIHVLKLNERNQFLWQRSLGSLESLRPYMHYDTDNAIDEDQLVRLNQKVVIIAEEPGAGKSASLASMSQLLRTEWMIWIDLKKFTIPSEDLLNQYTEPRERYEFILAENITEDSLSRGLLQICLHQEDSRQIYLIFDGFEDIKKDSKIEVLELLQYLSNLPTVKIWVSAQLHERIQLENALSAFAVKFENIGELKLHEYLVNFWHSHLLLEGFREENRSRLEEFTRNVYSKLKKDLGEDIHSFTGVPFVLRMLAEIFLEQVAAYVNSKTENGNDIKVKSAFFLYQKFIEVKYNIYRTAYAGVNNNLSNAIVAVFTESHRMLALRTLFPQFADEHYVDFESKLGGDELSRIGLVHMGGDGSENVEFIHRTLAEYFCADYIVHHIGKKGPSCGWAVELLLTDLLLRDSNKIIRMFINNFLLEHPKISDTAQEYTITQIIKFWHEKQDSILNDKKQTVLHVAHEEKNYGIITFLTPTEPQSDIIPFLAAHNPAPRY